MSLGVTIRPLKSFGLNNAIRVTVGTAEQNEFFIRCLEKIV
jgi:histidinol-phosphate/aromatic aminotransferase/cobyric acid decarboxylase-like protein